MTQPSAPPAYEDVVEDKNNPDFGQPAGLPYPSHGSQPAPVTAYPSNYRTMASQPYHAPESTVNQPLYHSAPPNPSGAAEAGGFTLGVGGTFNDQTVRRLFIRKVYITLSLQLLVTFGIVCIFTFIPDVHVFVRKHAAMYYVAYAIFLVLYITLVCCGNVRRKHPLNIYLLIAFTLALSYMVGTIASFYKTQSVVIALGITVAVCVAVTLFSMQTRIDFTKCAGLLFVLVLVLFLFGFITIFTYRYTWYLHVVYGALGALVFTLFLAFDTQLIMGGKRYELEPEEYIYGALNLYIDVVYIFVFILSLVGGSNN